MIACVFISMAFANSAEVKPHTFLGNSGVPKPSFMKEKENEHALAKPLAKLMQRQERLEWKPLDPNAPTIGKWAWLKRQEERKKQENLIAYWKDLSEDIFLLRPLQIKKEEGSFEPNKEYEVYYDLWHMNQQYENTRQKTLFKLMPYNAETNILSFDPKSVKPFQYSTKQDEKTTLWFKNGDEYVRCYLEKPKTGEDKEMMFTECKLNTDPLGKTIFTLSYVVCPIKKNSKKDECTKDSLEKLILDAYAKISQENASI